MVPVALYQARLLAGLRQQLRIRAICAEQQQRHAAGLQGTAPGESSGDHARPAAPPSPRRRACAARSTPSWTGSERDAHAAFAFDRLEVVERHDAVRADAVERGEQQDAPVRQRREHHGRAGEPGQALVAERRRRRCPTSRSASAAAAARCRPRRATSPTDGGDEAPGAQGRARPRARARSRRRRRRSPIGPACGPTESAGAAR